MRLQGDVRHEEEPEWMLGRAFPLWITFREQKKADQFQIDGPVTLISKWRSVNEREREREWWGGVGHAAAQLAGFIFEGIRRGITGVVTMLWSFYHRTENRTFRSVPCFKASQPPCFTTCTSVWDSWCSIKIWRMDIKTRAWQRLR